MTGDHHRRKGISRRIDGRFDFFFGLVNGGKFFVGGEYMHPQEGRAFTSGGFYFSGKRFVCCSGDGCQKQGGYQDVTGPESEQASSIQTVSESDKV